MTINSFTANNILCNDFKYDVNWREKLSVLHYTFTWSAVVVVVCVCFCFLSVIVLLYLFNPACEYMVK